MQREFKFEKETKNTIRFQEVPVNDKVIIGPVYIQKEGLALLNYKEGNTILIDINIKEN